MDIKERFLEAYRRMDEPVVSGDCGALCNRHCCREKDEQGARMGIYLLPMEYESVFKGTAAGKTLQRTWHAAEQYDMPAELTGLWFAYCRSDSGCLREYRPIQCRTYPFEPHLEAGALSLVVLQDQIHICPLLERPEDWRQTFVDGVYEGWKILLEIPQIRKLIAYDSDQRRHEDIRLTVRR